MLISFSYLAKNSVGGSDTVALAYAYGARGSLADIAFSEAQSVIGDASFGAQAQNLKAK